MPKCLRIGVVLIFCSPAWAGAANHYFNTYTLTDLGQLAGAGVAGTRANGINNAGQITGYSVANGANTHAFRYSGGQMEDLGTIGGANSEGFAINDLGVVVGDASSFALATSEGVVVAGGYMNSVGFFGGNFSTVRSIGESGAIVGFFYTTATNTYRGFLREQNGATGLIPLLGTGTQNYAYGINSQEYIVGAAQIAANSYNHAALFAVGQTFDLTPSLNDNSAAYALNSASGSLFRVVGSIGDAMISTEQAVMFVPGSGYSLLGNLGFAGNCRAEAVNDLGTIVGTAFTTTSRGFIYYSQDDSPFMLDLNSVLSAVTTALITEATGVNNAGQICANGYDTADTNHTPHAYLLTPVAAVTPTPTPSPSSPTAPVVAVAKKSLHTGKPVLMIKGLATGTVTSVTYQIGKKKGTAAGTTAWTVKAQLKPGKNTIVVIAHGPGGDSAPIKLTIKRTH